MEQKFFLCEHCGNMVAAVKVEGCPITCCGKPMKELVPGTSDGAHEKHVPVWSREGNKVTVTVGEVEHPMLDAHYIDFVALRTKSGCQVKKLHPGEAPKAEFAILPDDEVVAVYEYCNLHGLWKA